MIAPASEITFIKPGIDYLNSDNLIFTIHCTKTNECDVTITTINNDTVTFPPGSFIRGAVYHIYIKKMEYDIEKASFFGYSSMHRV